MTSSTSVVRSEGDSSTVRGFERSRTAARRTVQFGANLPREVVAPLQQGARDTAADCPEPDEADADFAFHDRSYPRLSSGMSMWSIAQFRSEALRSRLIFDCDRSSSFRASIWASNRDVAIWVSCAAL